MAEDLIQVALRIRPLLESEIVKGCQICLDAVPGEPQVQIRNTDKAFRFNHVFAPTIDQKQFYNSAIKQMIPNIFEGFNITILAYGQTGSGKTHSMGTNYTAEGDNYGIIPRAVHDIFDTVDREKEEWSFKVTVSFLELYQEQLYDLLANKERNQCIVDIREDMKNIIVVGLTEKLVNDAQDTLRYLAEGSACRATGATAMNMQSSRSHAVFTITVHQDNKTDSNKARMAKFHLVDLAGSERSKKTQATGERFKEGININKGLLALGNVISQLGEGGNSTYVGYRDSKLTRLLQDSLGGNSKTLMIACVSPADYNLDETISTLRYADRARKIKNKPVVNQDPRTAEMNRLQERINELQQALENKGLGDVCPPEHKILQKKLRSYTKNLDEIILTQALMHEKVDMLESVNENLNTAINTYIEDLKKLVKASEDLMNEMDTNPSDEKTHRSMFEKIYFHMLEIRNQLNTQGQSIIASNDADSQPTSANNLVQSDSLNASEEKYSPKEKSLNLTYDIDKEHEEHTLRQTERNNQVQYIDRELAIKEKMIMNLMKNSSMNEHLKEVDEMQDEIKKLQEEKASMQATLNSVHANTASSKLAETRRKKIQELEKKISELNRKVVEQKRILKAKEKLDQQIQILKSEIQTMKQTKVKLIRQMRSEAEKFIKWKQMREREFNQLKAQDRKLHLELTRMKTQHSKQQIVYKRKMEEAQAATKRYKSALEKHKNAQQKREKFAKGLGKEEIQARVTQELDIFFSTIDVKTSLEKLLQERENTATLLSAMEQKEKENNSVVDEQLIAELQEELKTRNTQIIELQTKVVDADQENRVDNAWSCINNLADAKTAFETLIEFAAEERKKEHLRKCDELVEDQNNSSNEDWDIENEQDEDKLNEKLEFYKEKCNNIKKKILDMKPKRRVHLNVKVPLTDDFVTDDSIIYYDDTDKDPDWKKTPLYKQVDKLHNPARRRFTKGDTLKRFIDGENKCACKLQCKTRLCSCRKNNMSCKNCNCNPDTCMNKDEESIRRTLFKDLTNEESGIDAKKSKFSTEDTLV